MEWRRFFPQSSPSGPLCLWLCVVVALQLVIHLWMSGLDPEFQNEIYEGFGLRRAELLNGAIWQLVTYVFLHGAWWHVVTNALMWLMLGRRLRWIIGDRRLALLLLGAVISGGAVQVLSDWGGEGGPMLIGSSAGAFALLMMLVTLSPESRMWPLPVSGRNLSYGILTSLCFLFLINPRLGVPLFSNGGEWLIDRGLGVIFFTSEACHLGGALFGLLMGKWMLRSRVSLEMLRMQRVRNEQKWESQSN